MAACLAWMPTRRPSARTREPTGRLRRPSDAPPDELRGPRRRGRPRRASAGRRGAVRPRPELVPAGRRGARVQLSRRRAAGHALRHVTRRSGERARRATSTRRQLTDALPAYGEEPHARRIARAIVEQRRRAANRRPARSWPTSWPRAAPGSATRRAAASIQPRASSRRCASRSTASSRRSPCARGGRRRAARRRPPRGHQLPLAGGPHRQALHRGGAARLHLPAGVAGVRLRPLAAPGAGRAAAAPPDDRGDRAQPARPQRPAARAHAGSLPYGAAATSSHQRAAAAPTAAASTRCASAGRRRSTARLAGDVNGTLDATGQTTDDRRRRHTANPSAASAGDVLGAVAAANDGTRGSRGRFARRRACASTPRVSTHARRAPGALPLPRTTRRRVVCPGRRGHAAVRIRSARSSRAVLDRLLIGLIYLAQTVHLAATNYAIDGSSPQRDDLSGRFRRSRPACCTGGPSQRFSITRSVSGWISSQPGSDLPAR